MVNILSDLYTRQIWTLLPIVNNKDYRPDVPNNIAIWRKWPPMQEFMNNKDALLCSIGAVIEQ